MLAVLLATGCKREPCAGPSPWALREAGMPCEEGVQRCERGLGCMDGLCGACGSAADCLALDGCSMGVCGRCTGDGECREGERCLASTCVPAALSLWELSVAPADWASMLADPYADTWHDCALEADGRPYRGDCVFRIYGSTSRNYPKKSFRIKLDGGGPSPGWSDRITLRAEYNDPSYLRTLLGYESFRRLTSLPAPRIRPLRLSVNGALYGIMMEVEKIDEDFLAFNGRDPNASTFKADHAPPYGALVPLDCPTDYEEIDGREMYPKAAGPDDDYSELIELVEEVLWPDWLDARESGVVRMERTREVVDLDPQVSYLALMAAIQNRDHVAANYYLSHQSVGRGGYRWEVYPYDLDTSFGCVFDPEAWDNICDDLEYGVWWLNGVFPEGTPVGAPNSAWGNMLIHLVLREPSCEAAFYERLREMLDDPWWNERMPLVAEAWRLTLRDASAEDIMDLNETPEDLDAAVDAFVLFLSKRKSYLLQALNLGCCG
jgi:hypothetical protein